MTDFEMKKEDTTRRKIAEETSDHEKGSFTLQFRVVSRGSLAGLSLHRVGGSMYIVTDYGETIVLSMVRSPH